MSRRLCDGLIPVLLLFAGGTMRADSLIEVTGTVRDAAGRPIAGAVVALEGGSASTHTDRDGSFRLPARLGQVTITASGIGYQPAAARVVVSEATPPVELSLRAVPQWTESVVVQAIRADESASVTKTDIDRDRIEQLHYGQEVTFLLNASPSINQYADSGIAAGYSYFQLRGIQQTRVNMTFDGVPLNDSEDSYVYFSNYANLAGSLESIQIQRGVGSSTIGAASYAGSINFESLIPSESKEVDLQLGTGSFGTNRGSIGIQSGRLGKSLRFYARGSCHTTDGFREHSGVDQGSVFFGASHEGRGSMLNVTGFVGRERTQLAYLATEKDILDEDLRFNPLSSEERDRFGQQMIQATWSRSTGASSTLSFQGYYQSVGGWYRIWDGPQRDSLYEYSVTWRAAGASAVFRRDERPLRFTIGLHLDDFESRHSRDIVDVGRQYENRGAKNETSGFLKLGYRAGRWHLYADAQLRSPRFGYRGDAGQRTKRWTFFNPKAGVRYDVTAGLGVYASLGQTTREPTRSDLLSGQDNAAVLPDFDSVKPERVTDLELGIDYRRSKLTLLANLYAMEFRNEIALTGELSEIGLPLRRNVGESYRRGLEIDLLWRVVPRLAIRCLGNLSSNRIHAWRQFFDVYDAEGKLVGSESRDYRNREPLLTPTTIANLGLDLSATSWLSVGATGRYVARAYLDNVNDESLTTPSYFNLDTTASLDLSRWIHSGRPRIRVFLNNILNDEVILPNGYSYLYLVRGAGGTGRPSGIPYYYPLATRSIFVTLDVSLAGT
ncbi:MAG: TonB-dependent receptor [Acidobacteriota bacterium]